MNFAQILLTLCGILALGALLLGLCQGFAIRRLRRELHQVRTELTEQQNRKPATGHSPDAYFGEVLRQAEQQATVERPADGPSRSEKYRYVAALAEQGMDARGIARALQLGPAEVEQLLRLARLQPTGG